MNIKVAIRVRPFNNREKELKSDLCIRMDKKNTYIMDEQGEEKQHYSYDYCFWSHDGYNVEQNGYMTPQDNKYHDQQYVYDCLGKEILSNALKGYNCCLFAYGQTGSGKSYSIFGYGNNKGIVPLVCDELLNGECLKSSDIKSKVSISMLEIYNEKVQDLLIPIKKRPNGGLKVRENQKSGVFVAGLSKYEVTNYEEIENIIEKGNKNKSLGATLMNATSSRAHTIICLEVIQKKTALKKNIQKTSNIFLVDLAGSEKVGKTGAKADRLKEACSINKSLSVLGIVIHQLYKLAIGKKTIVSYRDSVLTRILQDALGGNSKTTMICAISPARDNLEETMSTLRYANQAKMIKLNAIVNESETDKLIRELTEENKKLKNLLDSLKKKGSISNLELEDVAEQIKELEEHIRDNEDLEQQDENTKKKKERIRRESIKAFSEIEEDQSYQKQPHIMNLNEDPMLKKENQIKVGRQVKGDGIQNQIILNGASILQDHAIFVYNMEDQTLYLKCSQIEGAENTFINGQNIIFYDEEEESDEGFYYVKQLEDLDRVIFGTSTTFLVRIPIEDEELINEEIDGKIIDWEFCQSEKFEYQEKPEREKLKNELEIKKQELEENEKQLLKNMEIEKEKYQQMIKEKQEEFVRSLNQLQNEMQKQSESFVQTEQDDLENKNQCILEQIEIQQKTKELEFQLKIQKLKKEAQILEKRKEINNKIQQSLINYYSKIKEANTIAEQLNRNIQFHPFVDSINLMPLSIEGDEHDDTDLIVKIKVVNQEEGWLYYWSLDKFEERLELMREILDNYFNFNIIPSHGTSDPFWDPNELVLSARGICLVKNNIYRFTMDQKVSLLDSEGHIGYIKVLLEPVDNEGQLIDEEEIEEEIEEPQDLIEKGYSCHMKISFLELVLYNVVDMLGKKISFSYSIMSGNGLETFYTPVYIVKDNQIPLHYSQVIQIEKVTLDIIQYYMEKQMHVQFFCESTEKIVKKGRGNDPTIKQEKKLFKHDYKTKEEKLERLAQQVGRRKSSLLQEMNLNGEQKNLCCIM